MTMTRWDPFGEALTLRDAMNRLFEQAILQPGGDGNERTGGGFTPALDITEDNDDYCLRASLPGVRAEDVDIQIQQGTVTISGELKDEQEHQKAHQHQGKYHMRERRQGRFYRSITFSSPLDASKAKATFEHGVLQLTIPKAEESKPRHIQVQAGGSQQSQSQTSKGSASQQHNAEQSQQKQTNGGSTAPISQQEMPGSKPRI